MVDLEICFCPLLGEVRLALVKVPSFGFSVWCWLKSRMHSSQFTRCYSGSPLVSSLT